MYKDITATWGRPIPDNILAAYIHYDKRNGLSFNMVDELGHINHIRRNSGRCYSTMDELKNGDFYYQWHVIPKKNKGGKKYFKRKEFLSMLEKPFGYPELVKILPDIMDLAIRKFGLELNLFQDV